MWSGVTELEIIMREALLENGLFFDEQVYVRDEHKHYTFDFVVYGEYCKIVVECDGPHHFRNDRSYKDSIRDLWTVNNGFQDALRFDYRQLRNNIQSCIHAIQRSIRELDQSLSHDQERKKLIEIEKEKIRNRKNSPFYKGDRPNSKYSGLRVEIPQKNTEMDPFDRMYESYRKSVIEPSYWNKRYLKQNHTPKQTEKLVEVEKGIKITKREIRFYQNIKKLSLSDKSLLWKMMKNTTKDGYYIFKGDSKEIQNLCNHELVEINYFYRSYRNEISLKVLPNAPHLFKAYIKKGKKR